MNLLPSPVSPSVSFSKLDLQPIEIEVSFNGENKRLLLEAIPSNNKQFGMMSLRIGQWFQIEKGQKFVMQYIDSENDLITIGSAIEFKEAITQYHQQQLSPTFALILKPLPQGAKLHVNQHRRRFESRKSTMQVEEALSTTTTPPPPPISESSMLVESTQDSVSESTKAIGRPKHNRASMENKHRFRQHIEEAEIKFASQLQTLEGMSLIGDSRLGRLRCIRLLKRFDGDIGRVIDRIESDRTDPTNAQHQHHRHGYRHHDHHHLQRKFDKRHDQVEQQLQQPKPVGKKHFNNKHEFEEAAIKFSQELVRLKQMGYKRKRVLVALLNQHNGNIEAVLSSLNTC